MVPGILELKGFAKDGILHDFCTKLWQTNMKLQDEHDRKLVCGAVDPCKIIHLGGSTILAGFWLGWISLLPRSLNTGTGSVAAGRESGLSGWKRIRGCSSSLVRCRASTEHTAWRMLVENLNKTWIPRNTRKTLGKPLESQGEPR